MNNNRSNSELLEEIAEKNRLFLDISQRLDNLHHLLNDMSEGFGVIEIIPGSDGKILDFRLLEINETLGRLLKVSPKDIHGIPLLQLLPDVDSSWLEVFGDVVAHQRPAQFEKYSFYFEKWFKVQASCAGPGLLNFLLVDITASKQAEQELAQNRLLLGQADLLSLSGAWEWRIVTDQFSFTPGWLSIHGCKKAPRTLDEIMASTHPDDRTALMDELENARKSFDHYSIEYRIIRQDNGKVRYVHGYGKLVRDPSGEIAGVLGITRDITEQKLSEKATQRQNILKSGINSIFAAVVKSADDKEFATTCLSVVEKVTESPLSLLAEIGSDGLLRDIAASNPTWEKCSLVNPQDSKKATRLPHTHGLYASVYTQDSGFLTNDPVSHPDSKGVSPGHPELQCFMTAPLQVHGITTGMISVANRYGGYTEEDLAVLKTLARVISDSLSRWRAERALVDGENRYRNLFMNSPDAIFVNQEDKITLVNNACIRLFGAQQADDLLGRSPYELYHPDYHEKLRERIYKLRKLHESLPPYETKIVRLDGVSVDVEITSDGYLFGNSRNIHVILRNISENKRAAEELKRSNKELEEFAYAISHDLQEPIRSIIGFLQLFDAKFHDRVDEQGLMYIDRTIAASHRMKKLIENLLSLSRVSTKGGDFLPTELNHVVGIVIENLHSTINEKNAKIIYQDLPVLTVDASQIQRLFQNLIANAVKYNTNHTPMVEIGCRPAENRYEFFVKDNGIGIQQNYQERIFLAFQRLHTDREYEGIGMGLTLCKKIVKRHYGRIWVESQPGEGSTFYFTLAASLGG